MQREIDEVGLSPEDLIKVMEIKITQFEDFLPTVSGMSYCKAAGKLKRLRKEISRLENNEV